MRFHNGVWVYLSTDIVSVRNIKESTARLAQMAALQAENRAGKAREADLGKKVEELQLKIEEFNMHVGDEVPELIRKMEEVKSKLRAAEVENDKLQEQVRLNKLNSTAFIYNYIYQ